MRIDDTLVAHHAYASHFPQSLAHCYTEHLDGSPWKHEFKSGEDEAGKGASLADEEALARYNAADVRRTKRLWDAMQPNLERERTVYEADMALARVTREMTFQGIGCDAARKQELSARLRHRVSELDVELAVLAGNPRFRCTQTAAVRDALYRRFGVRVTHRTERGLESTAKIVVAALAGEQSPVGAFCRALQARRLADKIRSTYVDGPSINAQTGRIHYSWRVHGTVSGRLACKLQSAPRWKPGRPEGEVRGMYVAEPGNVLLYYDLAQAEMRAAAYLSGDPVFIAACKGDLHANNARMVFPAEARKGWLEGEALKDPERGKKFRDICKNLGFAISYCAAEAAVFANLHANGFPVPLPLVVKILAMLRSNYRVYYRYVNENHDRVRRDGFMRTAVLGRIRWFGWNPPLTEVANFPVQSLVADVMNARTVALFLRLPRECRPVFQGHDAFMYEAPMALADQCEREIREVWEEPVLGLAGGPLVFPIDFKRGARWSELG
jgi:DNA polymerase I-like protein with 3'-5' exonuclease and polymerase domains